MIPIILGLIEGVVGIAARGVASGAMRRIVASVIGKQIRSMTLKGAREASVKINEIADGLSRREFESILREWIRLEVLPMAHHLVPKRTGYLDSTIYGEAKGYEGTVGARAHYALYVEEGTATNRAQPYLKPSVDRNLNNLRDRLEAALARKGL